MEGNLGGERSTQKEAKEVITERQSQYLRAYRETRSAAKAARLLGVTQDSAIEALKRVARSYGKQTIRELLGEETATNKNCATAPELMRLLKAQDYRCALTGEKLTPNTAELDHKTPKSKGGKDVVENLQWLDRDVNRMKGKLRLDC